MSAQLTLTDAEMDALQRCVILAGGEDGAFPALSVEMARAAASASRKLTPHIHRRSRRSLIGASPTERTDLAREANPDNQHSDGKE